MCGVYFKILKTGNVKIGDVFTKIVACPHNKTIAEVYKNKRIEKNQ
jgi:MOSC domain-containing protein YiiM